MSKKPDKITQVRINPELAKKVDELRDKCEFKVSRNSFVESLIAKGIGATEKISDLADNSGSTTRK